MHSRELIIDHRGIDVRKPNISSPRYDNADRETPRQGHTDSRLALLYQDTLEAPIPQDILRLLEKLGSAAGDR